MAVLGILSLNGMLIKNAIVLIDETDTQSATGKDRMLAVVVICGLIFATILTLIVVPTLYILYFRVKTSEV